MDNTVKSPAPQQPSASTSSNIQTAQTFAYPYPFTNYAYMSPHPMANGQVVPMSLTAPQVGTSVSVAARKLSTPMASPWALKCRLTAGVAQIEAPPAAPPPPQQETHSTTHSKRSPRHCCKCGSQDCKGKGGRNFCMNACQDCGKLDCKGRNSRRPDKKCSEGWN